jgi:hypothetical protein
MEREAYEEEIQRRDDLRPEYDLGEMLKGGVQVSTQIVIKKGSNFRN